jgi:hypothetical protein
VREGVVGAARSGRGLAWRRWRGRRRFLTAGQHRGGEVQRGEDREQNTSRGHGVSSAMIDGAHDSGGGDGVNTLRSERGTPSFSTVAYDPAGHVRGRKLVAPAQYRRGALANGGYFQTRLGPYGVWASPVRPGQLGFSVADRYHL